MTLGTRDSKEHTRFRVNRGVAVNVIPEKYVHGRDQEEAPTQLKMHNRTTITPKCKCQLPLRDMKIQKTYSVEFIMIEEYVATVLGKDTSGKTSLITVNFDLVFKSCFLDKLVHT